MLSSECKVRTIKNFLNFVIICRVNIFVSAVKDDLMDDSDKVDENSANKPLVNINVRKPFKSEGEQWSIEKETVLEWDISADLHVKPDKKMLSGLNKPDLHVRLDKRVYIPADSLNQTPGPVKARIDEEEGRKHNDR